METDLSNLKSYTVRELKGFCKLSELKEIGTSKSLPGLGGGPPIVNSSTRRMTILQKRRGGVVDEENNLLTMAQRQREEPQEWGPLLDPERTAPDVPPEKLEIRRSKREFQLQLVKLKLRAAKEEAAEKREAAKEDASALRALGKRRV
ncbi:hypothetical protein NDU88_002888 [Pleurodeles waltl]|uniref:Uncharacterized protein n=1 Tax=Pleurodeles waltl TaxID=8319 RepID=A0AAV7VFQ4_PLEWA|nr:hypothetical protein NDU88_002888 [Pleurodeles waltl]